MSVSPEAKNEKKGRKVTATKKLFLAGRWEESGERMEVVNPYSGAVEASVYSAGSATVVEAATAAVAGFSRMRWAASHVRAKILRRTAELLEERQDEVAHTITRENGKPIRLSHSEVGRAAHTFSTAAEEATRLHGEVLPLDLRQGLEGRFGLTRRVPVGPVLGISPFNFPLNLVAHKVAPALAAGCSIVLKPASRTPLTALTLAEILEEAGLPPGGLSVLPCSRMVGDLLVQDDRFKALSFTGSPEVGFALKAKAGKKPVVLELGGNAGVIVHDDADLDDAVQRCVAGAFAYAGQVCISVQRPRRSRTRSPTSSSRRPRSLWWAIRPATRQMWDRSSTKPMRLASKVGSTKPGTVVRTCCAVVRARA